MVRVIFVAVCSQVLFLKHGTSVSVKFFPSAFASIVLPYVSGLAPMPRLRLLLWTPWIAARDVRKRSAAAAAGIASPAEAAAYSRHSPRTHFARREQDSPWIFPSNTVRRSTGSTLRLFVPCFIAWIVLSLSLPQDVVHAGCSIGIINRGWWLYFPKVCGICRSLRCGFLGLVRFRFGFLCVEPVHG